MAYPIVEGVADNVGGIDAVSHTANMPAGVVAGETLILVVVSYYDGAAANSFNTPAGWTRGFEYKQPYVSLEFFYKTAGGSESTVSLTPVRPEATSYCHSYRVSGTDGIEFGTVAFQDVSASVDTVTAPTITPSWSGDTLYMFVGGGGRTNALFSSLPAGYTTQDGVSGENAGGRGISLASGYKTGDGSAESPGDLVLATYNLIAANTIAIKGAGPIPPSLTVTQTELTPGGTISGSYSDYATVPTTLTVSDGTNTITIASPTISDNGDGTGTFSGTMPALPSSGTASLVLFGDVTVELS